jgi:hypothetical protein
MSLMAPELATPEGGGQNDGVVATVRVTLSVVPPVGAGVAAEPASTTAEQPMPPQLGAHATPATPRDAELQKLLRDAGKTLGAIRVAPPSEEPLPSYITAHLARSEAQRSILDERLRKAGVSPEALLSAKAIVGRAAAASSVRRTLAL